jgi:hypothetical protein
MQMKITEAQAEALRKNRVNSTKVDGQRRRYNSYGKSVKRNIYADIKRQHGLSRSKKIVFFLDNVDNPLYLVIRDKRTKLPLDDGKSLPAPVTTPALPAPVVQVEAKKVDAAMVDDFDFEAEFNQLLLEALTAQAGTTPSKAAKADAVAKVATAVKAVKAVKPAAKAVKPAAKAVKPAAKAVKPAAKAVKPAAKAVKPAAKAVKPAAKAIKAKPAPKAKAK